MLSVARGLDIRQVSVRLNGIFLVSSPGTSEDLAATDLARPVVGEVVWRWPVVAEILAGQSRTGDQ